MNRLESATEEYIAAILSSEEYVTYRQELEKVKQYPELLMISEREILNFSRARTVISASWTALSGNTKPSGKTRWFRTFSPQSWRSAG